METIVSKKLFEKISSLITEEIKEITRVIFDEDNISVCFKDTDNKRWIRWIKYNDVIN